MQMQSINTVRFREQEYQSKLNEVHLYKTMLTQAIIDKFYNNTNYSGKKYILRITLDDTANIIKSFEGDFGLCQAAISAVRLAELPKPSNLEIYEVFKNITLNFAS